MTFFDTKQSCFSYIKSKFFDMLDDDLHKSSKLELNYSHSQKTKSLYLSLMFKKELFKKNDPMIGHKFPYVIRISDHPITSLFSERMADADILVQQFLTVKQTEDLNKLKAKMKATNLSIFSTIDQLEISKLKKERLQLIFQAESVMSNSKFTFNANFESICSDIKKIITAHG